MPTEPTEGEVRARSAAAAAAARLLAELLTPPPAGPVQVEVSVTDGVLAIRIEVTPAQASRLAGGNGRPQEEQAGNSRLTPLDHLILSKATRDPHPMAWLSHHCGHENDSYFQSRVRRLARLKKLEREFEGYRLPQ